MFTDCCAAATAGRRLLRLMWQTCTHRPPSTPYPRCSQSPHQPTKPTLLHLALLLRHAQPRRRQRLAVVPHHRPVMALPQLGRRHKVEARWC